MMLVDVNVLIHAFRRDADRHREYRAWLERSLFEESAMGVSEFVLASVVRITTHPRVFVKPSSVEEALGFCGYLLEQPNVIRVVPGPHHWQVFSGLCRKVGAKGNLITDAYLAALAMETGAEWVTADRDFSRFPGLRWRHPLDAAK